MLQIILVDHHTVVRNGIKLLLESTGKFEVIAEVSSGEEVLKLLTSTKKVDIVLTGINMPVMDGISLLRKLKLLFPTVSVVFLTTRNHEDFVAQAFKYGADGYLLKSVGAEELIFALKCVSSGRRYACSDVASGIIDSWITSTNNTHIKKNISLDLSSREVEVLNLIALGLTNQEISEKLFLSKRTIEGHRQSLIDKTDSKNTAALIRFSVLNGIIR